MEFSETADIIGIYRSIETSAADAVRPAVTDRASGRHISGR